MNRDERVVLREAVGHLAFVATERHYAEQPELWDLGERGRARTLEDYLHHFRHLAALDPRVWSEHVAYCYRLFAERGFPLRWLEDAWRIMELVLHEELAGEVATRASALLHLRPAATEGPRP